MSEIHETASALETETDAPEAPEAQTETAESREMDSELDDNYEAYLQDEDDAGLPGNKDRPREEPEAGSTSAAETVEARRVEKPDESAEVDETDAPIRMKCRNEELAGSQHPETGVPFVQKQVEVEGRTYEVVAPEFQSEYDAQLPKDMYESTDRKQFKECNSQLSRAAADDPALRSRFSDEALEQIENGDTPDGYTWHHDVEEGKMQLVDTGTHQQTGHTGGRSLWGGGTENR